MRTYKKLKNVVYFAPIYLLLGAFLILLAGAWRQGLTATNAVMQLREIVNSCIAWFNLNTDDFKMCQQLYNALYRFGSSLGFNYFYYFEAFVMLMTYEISCLIVLSITDVFMLPIKWFKSLINKEV